MNKKPRIGITGPSKGWFASYFFTRLAIARAGGKSVRISPNKPLKKQIDGLVIGGGADVDPFLYGQEEEEVKEHLKEKSTNWKWYIFKILFYPLLLLFRKIFSSKQTMEGDTGRDELEYQLLATAIEQGLPVLGICRGAQLMNVYHGGTLFQEVGGFYTETPEVRTILPKKEVALTENSRLRTILNKEAAMVNALHHQAIRQVADSFMIAAKDRNGIIQGIEHTKRNYMIGVQWHPEYMPQFASQRRLFIELVAAAKAAAEANG